MELLKFKEKFNIKELHIYETEYWIWSLRPIQATLGAGVLSLKRECPVFGELIQEEFSDMNNIIRVIEKTLKKAFDYDVINYLMLMMVDKQVHFHVIPRYNRNINVFDIKWKDLSWPGVPNLLVDELEMEVLLKIKDVIKENLIV